MAEENRYEKEKYFYPVRWLPSVRDIFPGLQ
jgi:hypothetical protein